MVALKGRIADRIRRYVASLAVGEPVRYSEMVWAIMEEPGVVDTREVRLRRSPGRLAGLAGEFEQYGAEEDVSISPTEIAELVDSLVSLEIS